jgi:hypothetical protein
VNSRPHRIRSAAVPLESHLQAELESSLIDAVTPGVRDGLYLHKRAVAYGVVAGSPGGWAIAGTRVMRRVPDVVHFHPERKVKSFPEGEPLLKARIAVDQPGAPQDTHAAIPEGSTCGRTEGGRVVPFG